MHEQSPAVAADIQKTCHLDLTTQLLPHSFPFWAAHAKEHLCEAQTLAMASADPGLHRAWVNHSYTHTAI